MPSIIHRYLNRELFQHWLAITLVLWLVLVVTRFSLYLGQAATGKLPADVVLTLLALKSVAFLTFLLPLSLYLALLLVLGLWNQDRESLALSASGFSPSSLLRAIAWPVFLVVLLVSYLALLVVPKTAQMGYAVRAGASQAMQQSALVAGEFVPLNGGKLLMFADRVATDGHTLEDIFVLADAGDQQAVLSAARAIQRTDEASGAQHLVLLDGMRYDGEPGQLDYRVLSFQEYAINMTTPATMTELKRDAVPTRELLNSDDPGALAELQQRLSRPLSVIVLVVLATGLGRYRPNRGKYTSLFTGILIFIVYFNLLATARIWVDKQQLPVWPGLGWVHLLFMLLAVWLLWRRVRR